MSLDGGSLLPELRRKAQQELPDTSRFLFFDEQDTILCSSFKVPNPVSEFAQVKSAYAGSRDLAIRSGVRLNNQRFEVHRHDPPLLYGRTMHGDPHRSEAIAVCRVEAGPTGRPAYGVITFLLPNLTARMVPQLTRFCDVHLKQQTAAQ